MRKVIKIFTLLALFAVPAQLLAQQNPMSEEEQMQKMYELIDKEIENYANTLSLDAEQVFFVDSILTHNYFAMTDELIALSQRKISYSDAYVNVQDKWFEATYVAFQKILTEEQWQKYLKTGGAKDKKARDKRALKRNSK